MAFHPSGTRLATASWDQTVRVWDTATGHDLANLKGHTDRVLGVAFSPDGGFLASAGGADLTVRVWDCRPVVTGPPQVRSGARGTPRLRLARGVAVFPSRPTAGLLATIAVGKNAAQVWDLTSGGDLSSLAKCLRGSIGQAQPDALAYTGIPRCRTICKA